MELVLSKIHQEPERKGGGCRNSYSLGAQAIKEIPAEKT